MTSPGPVDYNQLLDAILKTLRDVSTKPLEDSTISQVENQAAFDAKLKHWRSINFNDALSDDDVWKRICIIPYFGGVKPIPDERQARTIEYLGNYREIGSTGWRNSLRGLEYVSESENHKSATSSSAYWNPKISKGPRIIEAAQALVARKAQLNSPLIDILVPKRLRAFTEADLKSIFANFRSTLGFGFVTTFHAMMDLGLPVVKPDSMLVRTVCRLGLITAYGDPASRKGRRLISLKINIDEAKALGRDPDFAWELQSIMLTIANYTGKTTREVDWLFAKMGMTKTLEEGREFVICDEQPKCGDCFARPMCGYAKAYHKPPVFKKSKKGGRKLKTHQLPAAA